MSVLASSACFLEAHYYSAGIRHHSFAPGGRPDWAPDADSVGFRDEFELNHGDSAVEVRRFAIGSDHVTWVGIFYRSVDAKLGDRTNHAGVGAWFRNTVPFDFHLFLHGLALLAKQMSETADPQRLSTNATKFQSAEFLPSYALPETELTPSRGFAFGSAGLVDTQVLAIRCDDVGACRELSDYLTHLLVVGTKPTPPRVLVHVAKASTAVSLTVPQVDLAASVVRMIPARLEEAQRQSRQVQLALDEANNRCSTMETELSERRAEAKEFAAFRKDPLHIVLEKLEGMSGRLQRLEERGAVSVAAPATTYWSPPGVRRNPVNKSVTKNEIQQAEPEGDWYPLVVWGLIIITIVTLILIAIFRGIPLVVDAFRNS